MGWRSRFLVQPWWTRTGGLFLGLVAGCTLDTCSVGGGKWDGAGNYPQPLGTYVHNIQQIQADKAEASDFVIFPNEWFLGGTEFGPYGKYHMTEMVRRLPTVPFPVVIQPMWDTALNEARRQIVVAFLTQNGIPDAEQRVLIAYPTAEGLYGEEAEIVYRNMIRNYRFQSYLGVYGGGYRGFGQGYFGGGYYGGSFGGPGIGFGGWGY